MNFEPVIGLEIHVELKTKSKMFSSAPVTYGSQPNASVLPLDMGFPGTMPKTNKAAVISAIRVCNALHLQIDNELWFDRKNYFYPDLPKGYQITQNERPIGKNGYLDVAAELGTRRIKINRLHLEEDTAMQHHFLDYTLLDYNRAGIPLMEIVTEPDIRSGLEAVDYVEKIRSIVTFSDVSNGKMEEGSLRCDVNISLRPIGSEKYGTKVEIKNLNSISNIAKAIEFESKRQEALLLSGGIVIQETRRFDDSKKETITMRVKTDAVDYKYFVEPNLVPIKLSSQFIKQAIESCPELAEQKFDRYTKTLGLSEYDAKLLTSDKDVATYFDEAFKVAPKAKLLSNWINSDIAGYLNKNVLSISSFVISPTLLAELVTLIDSGEISNKQARDIFEAMIKKPESPKKLASMLGLSQISDSGELLKQIKEVIAAFPQSVVDYKEGKDRALGFLVGQVMKKTGGKANPALTSKLVLEELKK